MFPFFIIELMCSLGFAYPFYWMFHLDLGMDLGYFKDTIYGGDMIFLRSNLKVKSRVYYYNVMLRDLNLYKRFIVCVIWVYWELYEFDWLS